MPDRCWISASFLTPPPIFRYHLPLKARNVSKNQINVNTVHYTLFLHIFFGGLECVGHSFAYVAHIVFLRDVWIRTKRAAVASGRATNLATHLPNLATHLPNLANYLPDLAIHLPKLATHLPNLATHLPSHLTICFDEYFP